MGTRLSSDPVRMEEQIVEAIVATFLSVPTVATYAKVQGRERFLDNAAMDIAETTVPDIFDASRRRTSLIEVGIPTSLVEEYAGNCGVQITFSYPITHFMEVQDDWDDVSLEFTNSTALFKAIYLRSMAKFAANRDLGYDNLIHNFLQLEDTLKVEDEETGSQLQVGQWSLEAVCTGILLSN